MTKRGHLPTALGPTLPSPRRDRQTGQRRGASGTVELWEAAQCGAERQRERGVWSGGGGGGATDGAPLATEITPSLKRSLPIGALMQGDVYCNTQLESRVY